MNKNWIVADLHVHSKYSRAVSKDMTVVAMAEWGWKKGINLLATGDWMHTLWFRELQANLEEVAEGIYESKDCKETKFLLGTEISSIYSQGGQGRRVHTLVLAPSFSVAGKINEELLKRGCNLSSDGRPIVGLSCQELAEVVLTVSEQCLLIPAHAWTPWFALYGSKSGFNSIEECFGEFSERIYAVETGLSSDPAMNWKIGELERRALVSFSDAHSPAKLGREATVFRLADSKPQALNFNYSDIYEAIAERYRGENRGNLKIGYTVEFYPEEGKYHFTGHRKCGVVQSPEETKKQGVGCSVCGRPLTVGVMHRVNQLADQQPKTQSANWRIKIKSNRSGVKFVFHPTDETRPPYVMLVSLMEILAEVHNVGVGAKKVIGEYERLIASFKSEFEVLLRVPVEELVKFGGGRLGEAISKMRSQDIQISPGYDGEFGKVKIWPRKVSLQDRPKQMGLF